MPVKVFKFIFLSMNSRILLLSVLFLLSSLCALSASAADMVVGNIRVIKVLGSQVEMIDPTGKKSNLVEGVFIQQGTQIITGPNSRVDLVFENGSSVNIGPSSRFSVDQFLQDPFNSDNLDYKAVEQAPTTSVTKISVPDGDIIFNVAKQKPGSSFEISTPVGTAGIRGTSGFAGRRGFGLATGSASFRTPSGNIVNVGAGSQVGSNGASSSVPPGLINQVNTTSSEMRSATPPNTFLGSPPNLAPQQQALLNSAASQGVDTIARVAGELAAADPASAADIAGMAATLVPSQALAIATSVAQAVPPAAPQVAALVARVVPDQAPQVAAVVAAAVPESALAVAQSVAQVAPQQALDISNAVVEAVPGIDPAAVQQAATQGASQAAQQGGGAAQAGPESRPQPSNNSNNFPPPPPPTPAPTITPEPTPTPTPVPSGL